MPWQLREEDAPELPWIRILNTGTNGYKKRERRRWWHSERQRVRQDLREGFEPARTFTRQTVRNDLW